MNTGIPQVKQLSRFVSPAALAALAASAAFGALAACATTAPDAAGDRATAEQIRHVLSEYVSGWRDGDAERLSRVFAAEGRIFWRSGAGDDQTLASMTFADAIARGRPRQPEYGRQWSVLRLDVLDDQLAVAKLDISRKGGSYVDYLVLQQIAGEWRIVVKTFVSR